MPQIFKLSFPSRTALLAVPAVPTTAPTTAPTPLVRIECKRWPVPGHGLIPDNLVFMTGDILIFQCLDNRVLYGPKQSRCMEDGNFQEVYPICLPGEYKLKV